MAITRMVAITTALIDVASVVSTLDKPILAKIATSEAVIAERAAKIIYMIKLYCYY